MPEKIKEMTPPRGCARLLFRFPILIYRLGLGGLLSSRFLLVTHVGCKTGKKRQTVLEVVRHDKKTTTFIVAAGFGPKSQWVRNIRVNPQVTIQSGRCKWDMIARFLPPEQAGEELLDYSKRNPLAFQELSRFMGFRLNGSQEDVRAAGQTLSMVEFQPKLSSMK